MLRIIKDIKHTFFNISMCSILCLVASCQKAENSFEVEIEPVDFKNQKISESFGLINFESYSIYVASGNKTVKEIAATLGIDHEYLSKYNGMSHFFKPETGTILALPNDFIPDNSIKKSFDIEATQKIISGRNEGIQEEQDQDSILIHTVSKDETIFKIARTYNISVKAISERNNLTSEFLVYPGQKLKIPIFQDAYREKSNNLSAAINFKDENSFKSPHRPKFSSESKNTQNNSDLDSSLNSQKANQMKLFLPVLGKIVKEFNLSAGNVRNEGIDIKAKKGSFVYSADDGVVMLVSKSAGEKLSVVIIKHHSNILTIYAGLSSVDNKKGDTVKQGQKIGTVNEINNVLHFEIRKGNKPLNPRDFLVFPH